MSIPPPDPLTFSVEKAWKPLHETHWGEEEAAHLLRRMGFTATPQAVKAALRRSPAACVAEAFAESEPLHKPDKLSEFEAGIHERMRHIYREIKDPDEKRRLQREARREEQSLFDDFALQWFRTAIDPAYSAREKFVLFLQDIFVVERQSIKSTPHLFSLQACLRSGIQGAYPELCKQVSREPAMARYLDLDKNKKQKPNENFARELFELFTLGEGNYTEKDIKEAARAFTGYYIKERREVAFAKNSHDYSLKTVFGEIGTWDGDEVIDITFRQAAARTFLVRELMKFYLGDTLPHEDYIVALGEKWAARDYSLRGLLEIFFQSHLFYHPAYRGNMVKSPVQFYLGLCQDLQLDIIPFEGRLLRSMTAMGQSFMDPPNVRGWLYGQNWINATTISARRQVVDYLFTPLEEDKLNGNEKRELQRARDAGKDRFLVSPERLAQSLDMGPEELARHLLTYFITAPSRPTYSRILPELIGDTAAPEASERVRNAVIALLQSPAYNLC
ncbi:DUF1800 domain-containing protein [Coraliomargarita parva]|uniref:DUF1800 domain-containing protein n=1 Tax=Coraliomargarita parva TaxID=3014050 RepID=UPI0022B3CD22|nr:DUF1800 family protein [Coraliomargarita parva]